MVLRGSSVLRRLGLGLQTEKIRNRRVVCLCLLGRMNQNSLPGDDVEESIISLVPLPGHSSDFEKDEAEVMAGNTLICMAIFSAKIAGKLSCWS